jgi:hypothetical protein
MNNNVVIKRISIFFLGLVIGLVAGHKHGVTEMKERFHNRVMKKVEKPVLLEKRENRKKLREHLERTETPKIRVPR